MGEIRRGSAAIQDAIDANANREGGTFRPFLPSIYWKENQEVKYVLFLTPMEETYTFRCISFIPVEGSKAQETVVAKTDSYFEEKTDQFEETWDATAREITFAMAVELEPVTEIVKGKPKPRGFTVATRDFERRILDDDGELTDDTEEATAPVIGVVAQSPYNFYNVVKSHDATDFPINEWAVKITRIGSDQNTVYSVGGYEDMDIDLTPLIEHLDGINYLDDPDEVAESIADMDDKEAAETVAALLLDKRVAELLDEERYDELFEGVTESMDKFGKKKKKGAKGKGKKAERKARPSQKRSKAKDPVEEDPGEEPEAEEKEEVTSESPAKAKLAALRAKAEEKRESKAKKDS